MILRPNEKHVGRNIIYCAQKVIEREAIKAVWFYAIVINYIFDLMTLTYPHYFTISSDNCNHTFQANRTWTLVSKEKPQMYYLKVIKATSLQSSMWIVTDTRNLYVSKWIAHWRLAGFCWRYAWKDRYQHKICTPTAYMFPKSCVVRESNDPSISVIGKYHDLLV